MTFKEFLYKYREGTLDTDAAWRAYDIESSINAGHVGKALKALGFGYAGDLALSTFMAQYGIADRREAWRALAYWWLLTQINLGRRMNVPLRRPQIAS